MSVGGIVDDTIITSMEDHIYVVLNAGCFEKDMVHLRVSNFLSRRLAKQILGFRHTLVVLM